MKYLIHSTQPVPAHDADVTGRALCGCGAAAWKRTKARSGYSAGEWKLVDGDGTNSAWDIAAMLKPCVRCKVKRKSIAAWAAKKAGFLAGREQACKETTK